jgi:hypothetical protein
MPFVPAPDESAEAPVRELALHCLRVVLLRSPEAIPSGIVRYRVQRKVPLQVFICERDGSRWNLAKGLDGASFARRAYFRRMQIEEVFRGLKHHPHIAHMPCQTEERKAPWLLLCGLGYSYLYLLGRVAKGRGLWERYHCCKQQSAF